MGGSTFCQPVFSFCVRHEALLGTQSSVEAEASKADSPAASSPIDVWGDTSPQQGWLSLVGLCSGMVLCMQGGIVSAGRLQAESLDSRNGGTVHSTCWVASIDTEGGGMPPLGR
ncbi:hypothetical protein ABBQ38_011113 [Trebouxia sp. C0009 RCD-2024]